MSLQTELLIYAVIINFTFWVTFLIVPITSLLWPWWKSSWGKNLISMDVAITIALLGTVLHIDAGVSELNAAGFLTTASAVFCAGLIAIWRTGIIIWEQARGATAGTMHQWRRAARRAARRSARAHLAASPRCSVGGG